MFFQTSTMQCVMCYVIQDKFQIFAPLNFTLNPLEGKTGIVRRGENTIRWTKMGS